MTLDKSLDLSEPQCSHRIILTVRVQVGQQYMTAPTMAHEQSRGGRDWNSPVVEGSDQLWAV